jgi:tetratricopeptide (TPR) repeat protein
MKTPNHLLTAVAFTMLISVSSSFSQNTPNLIQVQADAGVDRASSLSKPPPCTAQNGQRLINQGRYEQAIREFTCVIETSPTEVEGYRGRIEAALLLGRYSDALRDFSRITAYVLPANPDALESLFAGYAARLAAAPDDVLALTGVAFARWANFEYSEAIQVLNHLLEVQPDGVFGNLFRGSARLLKGVTRDKGVVDIERALALAPQSAHVRFIVADAYTYGLIDLERAFEEATLALEWGLDTPRVHAILATCHHAFGDELSAAIHIERHFELVTTELLVTAPMAAGTSLVLNLVPGRVYEISIPVVAGETLSIATGSGDFWDTIALLLAPDGTPVIGSDDENAYFAAIDWVAEATGTYRLWVTSFETINTGALNVTRD